MISEDEHAIFIGI